MRLYSTANNIFPREAIVDHYLTVDDVKIPIKKGTIVSPQTITTHRSESLYDDPHGFNP